MAQAYLERDVLGAVEVRAEVRKIRVNAQLQFRSLFGSLMFEQDSGKVGTDIPWGRVENLALSHGLKSLWLNGTKISIPANDPLGNIPDELLDDDEFVANVLPRVLEFVVKHNLWMGQQGPYRDVFGRYLPEGVQAEDPTESEETVTVQAEEEVSSTSGASSPSETPSTPQLQSRRNSGGNESSETGTED